MNRYGRNFRRLKKELSNVLGFHAPLTHNLLLTKGQGVATLTRATVATLTDFEGLLKTAKAGEARLEGARRVENLIPSTGTGSASLAVAAAKTMTLPAGDYIFSMGVGTGTATFSGTGGATGTLTASATNRTSILKTITAGTFIVTGSVATLIDLQVEQVTGQTNQNPSEYVSNGVLSAPYHGANVDRVKYFTTQNGNTVSSNVVTEATGTVIPEAILTGVRIEVASTNLAVNNNNPDSWIKTGITVNSNVATDIFGVLAADELVKIASGNQQRVQENVTLIDDLNWRCWSHHFKKTTGDSAHKAISLVYTSGGTVKTSVAVLNTNTGAVTSTTAGALSGVYDAGSYWRLYISLQANNTGNTVVVGQTFPFYNTNGSLTENGGIGTAIVCYSQLEVGQVPSSVIPTTAAAVTRNASVETYPNADNVSNTAGTVIMEATPAFDIPSATTAGYGKNWLIDFDSGIGLYVENNLLKFTDGTNTATLAWIPLKGITYKIAANWGAAGLKVFVNGVASSLVSFDGSINSGTNMTIGGYGGGTTYNWGGNIKNLKIYKKALSDAQIIEAQKTYLVDETGTQLFDESGNALFYY
jgi:hypothetical protein